MHDRDRTPAQWYSLIAGGVLLLVGILGFIVEANFDFGSDVEGDSLLGFEVNGTHNLVHLASGLLGLLAFRRRDTAKTFALAFGAVYLVVAIIGVAQGDHVLGIIPVNGADHVLHFALALAGLAAGFLSRGDDRADATVGRSTTSVGSTSRDSV
jgi:Domain of unknown function (DUF4383)